ncbi:hypothetical protein OTU49_003335 [Cherax quadricarinatus]|uniref:Protein kinase domain-containing protein n=1 Tax=Cherax quadricarinatus TaxID=27406 RepID=A0AAW0XGH2_CHEQU
MDGKKVTFISFEELTDLVMMSPECTFLGSRVSGSVYLFTVHGEKMCVKKSHEKKYMRVFSHELNLLQAVDSAGGAPLVRYMAYDYPAMVMEYRGHTDFNKFFWNCNPSSKCILALTELAESLQQVHDKGFLHMDIKTDNVLVQHVEGDSNFLVNIIDFGLAWKTGEDHRGFESQSEHYAIETHVKGKVSTTMDVYSFGDLISFVSEYLKNKNQSKKLNVLAREMMDPEAKKRPKLTVVQERLHEIMKITTKRKRLKIRLVRALAAVPVMVQKIFTHRQC